MARMRWMERTVGTGRRDVQRLRWVRTAQDCGRYIASCSIIAVGSRRNRMVEDAPLPVRPFMALVSSHTPRGCPRTGKSASHISHIHNSSSPSSLLPSLAPILPQVAPIDWAKYKNNIEAPGFVDFLKERYEGIDWSQLNTKLSEEEIAADAAGKAALVRYRAFPAFALRVCVPFLVGRGAC